MLCPCLSPSFKESLPRRKSAGFTLTEFAAVMAISGLLLVGALGLYNSYISDKYLDGFYEQQRIVRDSMDAYFAVHGRYPCPAKPKIAIDDPAAGIEDCSLRTATAPTCNTGGVCKRQGWRDTKADADTDEDFIFIGAVPYKTMKQGIDDTQVCVRTTNGEKVPCPATAMSTWTNITKLTDSTTEDTNMKAILDVWGYQMTYAVTMSLTDSSTFDNNNGAISVLTSYDITNPEDVTLVDPVGSAHYVIVHHGENNKGAFSSNGTVAAACSTGTADAVNCNKSADVSSPGTDGTFVAGMRVMVEGTNYFDDVVMFQAYAPPSFWRMTGSQKNPVVRNANRGNIGIGRDTPYVRLHVAGSTKADRVKTAAICDPTGNLCIEPSALRTVATCGDSATQYGVLQGFDYTAGSAAAGAVATGTFSPQCASLNRPVLSGSSGECSGSLRVVGFRSDGHVICE